MDAVRCNSKIRSEFLAQHVIYDTPERYMHLQALWKRVEHDAAFRKEGRNSLGHSERYVDACRKVVRFAELVQECCEERNKEELSLDEIYDLYIAVDENLPLDVHLSMFIPLMKYHTSPMQRQRWLPDALRFRMIGAYAQTEMAHGSNVRGIETIATYHTGSSIESTAGGWFEIHSPTLSSLKWWPGGLGHTCTHAVVYAQLYIQGKALGIHGFVVQLRDMHTHEPLPGIECGDIGSKLGYNSMDNGYARFTRVKVPRDHMLAGFAQVSEDGTYSKQPGAEKVAYGIMLDVRVRIVANSAIILARAVTIAIRYAFARLQGGQGGRPEVPVIDYPTQQRILLPALALNYGIHFIGKAMRRQYDLYSAAAYSNSPGQQQQAVQTQLPLLHLQSAGLKALITQRVHDSMEHCRKACGGHGFLNNSGFGELMTSYLPMCTLEGTREVLGQQTGRGLLKMRMANVSFAWEDCNGAGVISSISTSLVNTSFSSVCDFINTYVCSDSDSVDSVGSSLQSLEALVQILFTRAVYCVDAAKETVYISVQKRSGANSGIASSILMMLSTALGASAGDQDIAKAKQRERVAFQEALAEASSELVSASEAYSEYCIAYAFLAALSAMSVPGSMSGLSTVGSVGDTMFETTTDMEKQSLLGLQRLFCLLVLSFVERDSGSFYASRVLTGKEDSSLLQRTLSAVCSAVKDDSLNLAEAWQLSDIRLDSTLGREDGKYIEALYEAAQNEPLNEHARANKGVSEGYTLYLSSLLRGPEGGVSLPVARAKM